MTGRSLVDQLLGNGYEVRLIVRSTVNLSAEALGNPNTAIVEASVLGLTDEEMAMHVKNCDAVISCLGHTMDFKGMFGEPKNLCTDNAVMVASLAYHKYKAGMFADLTLEPKARA